MANTNNSLTVNLTIDESRNKVLFTESGKDFVDILLSFLTIPLGTAVRLCNKNSSVFCVDNLYKSVEGLGDEYFKAIPCKDMLLWPNYAAELECLDLPVNVEGNTDRVLSYYACSHNCCHELLSSYRNALCDCGKKMVRKVKVLRGNSGRDSENYDGVFLKRATQFMITDNLMIAPESTRAVLDLLDCDGASLNTVTQKQVKVGLSEVIAILRQSLSSENALTNVFLVRENGTAVENNTRTFVLVPSPCPRPEPSSTCISIKLVVDKHKNKCLYAECKQDFVDILFTLLTYPSGFITKRLNGTTHLICLDNLFASAVSDQLSDCFKTDQMKKHVINPKLPAHFRSDKEFVKSVEATPLRFYMCRTPDCDSADVSLVGNVRCKCTKIINKRMKITDPKRSTCRVTDRGFVSDATYIVTDDLVVTPFCFSTLTCMIASAAEGVVEVSVNIGEKEVLALMGAALSSQAVFTDVFLAKEETRTVAISAFDVDASDYVPV